MTDCAPRRAPAFLSGGGQATSSRGRCPVRVWRIGANSFWASLDPGGLRQKKNAPIIPPCATQRSVATAWKGRIHGTQTGMLRGFPRSASCVQRFDDSRNSAIHITYRVSLRSSSMGEPRDPLSKVVFVFVGRYDPTTKRPFLLQKVFVPFCPHTGRDRASAQGFGSDVR